MGTGVDVDAGTTVGTGVEVIVGTTVGAVVCVAVDRAVAASCGIADAGVALAHPDSAINAISPSNSQSAHLIYRTYMVYSSSGYTLILIIADIDCFYKQDGQEAARVPGNHATQRVLP